ncbi:MAG: hypothetical protein ACXQTD_06810 [Candidatus Syntropharchaeia archaeon]
MDLKKIDTNTLINIALYKTSGNPDLLYACYEELMRRRKIQEHDKDMIPFIKATDDALANIARRNAIRNPKVAKACYDEIIWRKKMKEIEELIEMERDLGKLENIIKDFRRGDKNKHTR